MVWRGVPLGISGGVPVGGGPPWSTKLSPLIPCSLFTPPDAILLGHEHWCDVICGLEVVFGVCGRKGTTASAEVGVFEAEQGTL